MNSDNEMSKIYVVSIVLNVIIGIGNLIQHFNSQLSQNKRYALSPVKICKDKGWSFRENFDDALGKTINHCKRNTIMNTIMNKK